MSEAPEKVLVYSGPSLDPETIREVLPEAIVMPPARQGDVISHAMEYEPSHILLVEGTFHQSLSVWHKELCWCLQIPGVKGVYGAASMGALRAADLWSCGMIGSGRIYEWYNEGVVTDESEVANAYRPKPDGSFIALTVPLVNVRGALLKANVAIERADELFSIAQAIHWSERSLKQLPEDLQGMLAAHNQKAIDALQLLYTFRELKAQPDSKLPGTEALSLLFSAQFERDRSVPVNNRPLKLQDLDAYITLHDQDYETHLGDADNRTLALLLADIYRIPVTVDEMNIEWQKFVHRLGLRSTQEHDQWMRANHLNGSELCRLMVEEVRLRKLRRALMTRSGPRKRTSRLLDYFKLNKLYEYWANAAAHHEKAIDSQGGEATLYFGGEIDVSQLLAQHAKRTGLTINLPLEEYAREMGFGTIRDLMIALARDKLGQSESDGHVSPERA